MIGRGDLLNSSRSKNVYLKLSFVVLIIVALLIVFIEHNKRHQAYSDVNEFSVNSVVERQLFIAMIREGDADAAHQLGRHLNFVAEDGYALASMCDLIAALKGHPNANKSLMAGKKDIRRLLLTTKVPDNGFTLNDGLQSQFFDSYWELLRGVVMEDSVMISKMKEQLFRLEVHEEVINVENIRAQLK